MHFVRLPISISFIFTTINLEVDTDDTILEHEEKRKEGREVRVRDNNM